MLPHIEKVEVVTSFNNLPSHDYVEFIGREHQVKEVIDAIENPRFPIVSIDGIGGVGKSTLAVECADQLSKTGRFDAIIWLCAKKEKLTSEGIEPIENSFTNLEDLFGAVLKAFGETDILKYNFETQKTKVLDILLQNTSCLLIIDNLETIEDSNLKSFIINDVPQSTKTLITSRERLGELEKVVLLKEFSLEETEKYIRSQLKYRDYEGLVSPELIKKLHSDTGGIPLALKIAIPWIIDGKFSSETLGEKVFTKSQVTQFCFEKTFNDFLDEDARMLFLILSITPSDISEAALRFISELNEEKFTAGINKLTKYSLVSNQSEKGEIVFSMLPLTQLFGRRMIEEKFKEIKKKVNEQYPKFLSMTSDERLSTKEAMAINKAEEAMRLYREGNDMKAEACFRDAMNYDKNNDYVLYLYAIFCKERQNYGQAEENIRRAINSKKENPRYWVEYSNISELWGDFKKAEKILEEGLEYCNNNIEIIPKLVVIKERLNKLEEAITLAKNNINMNPVDSKQAFRNTLFVVSILEGNWRIGYHYRETNSDKALTYFLNAINDIEKYLPVIFTNNPKYQFQEKKILKIIAEIYEQQGKVNEALQYYEKSLYEIALYEDRKAHNSNILDRIKQLKTKNI